MAERETRGEGMSFLDHLGELRRRLVAALLALLLAFLACYPFGQRIFAFLEQPVTRFLPAGEQLAYTRLTEPFMVHLKVAALAAVFVASPFLLLQVWLFVAPGLYRNEKRSAALFVGPATLCFLTGAAFAFQVLFPSICKFFLSQGESYRMMVTLDQYFSLLFWTVLGVALSFELPVLIGLLARMGLVSSRTLVRHLDAAMVGCLVVAAVITPTPDAITMLVVAAPLAGLYLISIVVARLLEPRQPASPGAP